MDLRTLKPLLRPCPRRPTRSSRGSQATAHRLLWLRCLLARRPTCCRQQWRGDASRSSYGGCYAAGYWLLGLDWRCQLGALHGLRGLWELQWRLVCRLQGCRRWCGWWWTGTPTDTADPSANFARFRRHRYRRDNDLPPPTHIHDPFLALILADFKRHGHLQHEQVPDAARDDTVDGEEGGGFGVKTG